MEVDEPGMSASVAPGMNVMANVGTAGSVTVSLHPLVIMNVSEHWTRIRAQHGKPMQGLSPTVTY